MGSGGDDGIAGRFAATVGSGVVDDRGVALPDGLGGGVAVADAVAAGVADGRALVAIALVVGAAVAVTTALVAAGALVRAVGDEPGMFRSVSVPHADAIAASASTSASGRLRG